MDGSLVSLFTWTKPIKSIVALICLNSFFWFLTRQRPLCVFSLAVLVYYLKFLWKTRIRPEILVDPPDQESWVTLSAYDIEYMTYSFGKNVWGKYWALRSQSHISWTILSCLMCYFLMRLGSSIGLLCLVFILSNLAFCVGPLLKYLPKVETGSADFNETQDLIPDESKVLWTPRGNTPEPESLTPFISSMPDHGGDESEDDFLFDSKHFESSSSTSSTNSFELVNI